VPAAVLGGLSPLNILTQAKGGLEWSTRQLLSGESKSHKGESCGIPPLAKDAKDGAPVVFGCHRKEPAEAKARNVKKLFIAALKELRYPESRCEENHSSRFL
jgi:hypothetical protein